MDVVHRDVNETVPRVTIRGLEKVADKLTVDYSFGSFWFGTPSFGSPSLKGVVFDGGGGKGTDTLTIKGTTGPDDFVVTADGALVIPSNDPMDSKGVMHRIIGVEQLTLDGGKAPKGANGDDTYQVFGLGTKTILVDANGTDVLDFSQATVGVNIDLSKSSGQAQMVFAPGNTNTLALKGTFENV